MILLYFFIILSVLFLFGVVYFEFLKTKDICNPLIFIVLLSIADFFIPSFIFLLYGIPRQPQYAPLISKNDLIYPVVLYFFSILLFVFSFWIVPLSKKINRFNLLQIPPFLLVKRLYFLILLSGGGYLTYLILDINHSGSLRAYLSLKAMRLYGQSVAFDNFFHWLLFRLSPILLTIFLMSVGILFYYRKIHKKPVLWGVLMPFLGWLSACTTFFRGTQLCYFISLFFIEFLRRAAIYPEGKWGQKMGRRFAANYKTIISLALAGVLLFVAYGAVRNFYNARSPMQQVKMDAKDALFFEAKRMIRGEGLIGLTRIIKMYPKYVDFLDGKTFYDMFLLPIPRAIYSSKPKWYGISDVTRRMGAPSSTQDAVTVTGELYANFGYLGTPLIVVFGFLCALFYQFSFNGRYQFVYAFILPKAIFATYWMSFTGLVNAMLPFPFLVASVLFVFHSRKKKINKYYSI